MRLLLAVAPTGRWVLQLQLQRGLLACCLRRCILLILRAFAGTRLPLPLPCRWAYMMVDEAHRLKNDESALYKVRPPRWVCCAARR